MPAIVDHEPIGGGAPISIFESGATMTYLAEKTGRFCPPEPRRKHDVAQWVSWQLANQGPKLGEQGHFRRALETGNNGDLSEGAANDMKKSATTKGESPSRLIDARIKELDDWRGKTLSHVRALIKQADPEVVEEWKWRGVPVWSHDGLICTGETYKSVVKLTFAKGASLKDPSGLFNSSLEGNARRAIDLHEGDEVDGDAFKTLVREAVALNRSSAR
jgi:hypothetical protein